MHSTASDGRMSPAEVVRLAAKLGVETIALTDHDTTAGLAAAQEAAAEYGVTVLNGIELSSQGEGGGVDFLGYGFDAESALLRDKLAELREGRVERAREMVGKLNSLGVAMEWEQVKRQAGDGAIGRPHVAWALLEAGQVGSVTEAFERWIGGSGPAYVPRRRFTAQEVIALLREAGGVAVLAHAARSNTMGLVPELVEMGLEGLEVYYPGHSRKQVRRLLRLCGKHELGASGGSDFHGMSLDGTASLGGTFVPAEKVEWLLRRTAV